MIDNIGRQMLHKGVTKMADKGNLRRFIKGAVAGMTLGALVGTIIILAVDVAPAYDIFVLAIPAILAMAWGGIRVLRHRPSSPSPGIAP